VNDDLDIHGEQRAISIALIAAGGLPVAGWLGRGGAVGAGITLSFAMIALGVVSWVAGRRRAERATLPRAELRSTDPT
jgi:hypothetical protein